VVEGSRVPWVKLDSCQ